MMKLVVLVLVCGLQMARVWAQQENNYYKVKYNVNLEEVLRSDRLLTNYFACLTDTGKCTAAGIELKRIIPDTLTNKCKRCSPDQRESAVKVLRFLSKEKPEMWRALEDKFDPDGKFRAAARIDPEIRKYGITI